MLSTPFVFSTSSCLLVQNKTRRFPTSMYSPKWAEGVWDRMGRWDVALYSGLRYGSESIVVWLVSVSALCCQLIF